MPSPPSQRAPRWRPSLLAVVLTILGVGSFVRLGLWQIDRAEEKRALLTQYELGQHERVELTAANAATLPRFQKVRVSGQYLPERQILLDNMPSHSGQAGYHVVTPLQIDGGWVLVDRGWVPLGASREVLPDIAVDAEPRTFNGTLNTLPQAGLALENAASPADAPWPRVLSFPPAPRLEQELGLQLLPGLVLLDAAEPDGYERQWQTRFGFDPQHHIGYAVQWFAFAAAAVIIFILLGFRRSPQGPA